MVISGTGRKFVENSDPEKVLRCLFYRGGGQDVARQSGHPHSSVIVSSNQLRPVKNLVGNRGILFRRNEVPFIN